MDQQTTPSEHIPPASGVMEPAHPAPPAWTVKFVVPAPEGMPSDRMKARAELVRLSGGCEACCANY